MRIIFIFLACAVTAMAQARTVVASVEPLAMLAREVLGDRAEVSTLLRPDQTPHFASFTPSQAREVRDADLILWLGEEAEPHLAGLLARTKAKNLALLSVRGVQRLGGGHAHDDGHDHRGSPAYGEEGTLDPHLWLSPGNMRALARALVEELELKDEAVAVFERDLAQAVQGIKEELAPFRDTPWLSYHDPWHYFRQAVGLSAPLVVSEGLQSDTSSRHFAELAGAMQAKRVGCAIAEPEARLSLMQRLCSEDLCQVQALDPLGRDAETSTYTAFLRHLGDSFRHCLAPGTGKR